MWEKGRNQRQWKWFSKYKNLSEGRQVKNPKISQCHTNSTVVRGQHLPLSQHTRAEYFETSLWSVNVKWCVSGMALCSEAPVREVKVNNCCSLTCHEWYLVNGHISRYSGAFPAGYKMSSALIPFTARIGWFCGKVWPQRGCSVQESAWMPLAQCWLLPAPTSQNKSTRKTNPPLPSFPYCAAFPLILLQFIVIPNERILN